MKANRLLLMCLGLIFALAFQACDKDDDVTVSNPTIGGLTCPSAVFSTTATSGTAYNGTFTVPYTGGNGIAYTSGTAITSTGVKGLSATLNSGTLGSGNGMLTYAVTGTPDSTGTASFLLNFGGQTCTVVMPVSAATTPPTTGQ
ncbi:hypothetical protein [Emticicia sp. 17c]|uniref:hypothetical protein n=1 Tax=Emticicia sp. 17c TaxID=3127704 RepID=UPI00301D9ED5